MNKNPAYEKPHLYSWPATLCVPASLRLVYLDLNHWIAVAKVLSGHPDGHQHRRVLGQLLRSVERGQAVFPISLPIYVEILKIRSHRRRSDLRKAIERLGRFAVVANRHAIATHEVEALLDNLVGPNPDPVNSMEYLDWGVLRAVGMRGGFQVLNKDGEDVTPAARQRLAGGPDEFDRFLNEAELELNRQVLDGPSPQDKAKLRAQGYRPELILKSYVDEAAAEDNWARLLDQEPRWRRGRLRDAVTAREVAFYISNILKPAATVRGLAAFDEIVRGVREPRRAFDAMPSFDVSVSLKTEIHRNAQHRWTNNHVHDIHALASTLPYCDVVVTDREMASLIRRSKLDQHLGTTVLHRLEDLPDLL